MKEALGGKVKFGDKVYCFSIEYGILEIKEGIFEGDDGNHRTNALGNESLVRIPEHKSKFDGELFILDGDSEVAVHTEEGKAMLLTSARGFMLSSIDTNLKKIEEASASCKSLLEALCLLPWTKNSKK